MADVSDRAILRRFLLGTRGGDERRRRDGRRDPRHDAGGVARLRAGRHRHPGVPDGHHRADRVGGGGPGRAAVDAHPDVQVRPDRRAVRAAGAGEAGGDRTARGNQAPERDRRHATEARVVRAHLRARAPGDGPGAPADADVAGSARGLRARRVHRPREARAIADAAAGVPGLRGVRVRARGVPDRALRRDRRSDPAADRPARDVPPRRGAHDGHRRARHRADGGRRVASRVRARPAGTAHVRHPRRRHGGGRRELEVPVAHGARRIPLVDRDRRRAALRRGQLPALLGAVVDVRVGAAGAVRRLRGTAGRPGADRVDGERVHRRPRDDARRAVDREPPSRRPLAADVPPRLLAPGARGRRPRRPHRGGRHERGPSGLRHRAHVGDVDRARRAHRHGALPRGAPRRRGDRRVPHRRARGTRREGGAAVLGPDGPGHPQVDLGRASAGSRRRRRRMAWPGEPRHPALLHRQGGRRVFR